MADPGLLFEGLLSFFEADGIDYPLALDALEPGLDDGEIGAVDHDRHPGDVRLGGDSVEELGYHFFRFEQPLVHVDVDDVGSPLHLLAGHIDRRFVVPLFDQAGETARAGDVGALADHGEVGVGVDDEGFHAAVAGKRGRGGKRAGWFSRDDLGDGSDVIRAGAAAAAHHVEQPFGGVLPQLFGHLCRGFVVFAHLVGEAGIQVAGEVGGSDGGQIFDGGAHIHGSHAAVDSEGEQVYVFHGIPERFGCLAGQGAVAGIAEGDRDYDRQTNSGVVEVLLNGVEARLEGEGVEDGFDQEEVDAPFDKAPHLGVISSGDLIETVGAEAGVVDVGGEGQGDPGRADGTGHKARLVGRLRGKVSGGAPGDLGGGDVDFLHLVLKAVILQRDRGCVEGVGLDQIGTGFQVVAMDFFDDLGAGEAEEIVASFERERMVPEQAAPIVRFIQAVALDHGAHGAVEDQDSILEDPVKFFLGGCHMG